MWSPQVFTHLCNMSETSDLSLQECFPLSELCQRKRASLACTRVMGQWWSGYFLMELSSSWPLTIIKRCSMCFIVEWHFQSAKFYKLGVTKTDNWLRLFREMRYAFMFVPCAFFDTVTFCYSSYSFTSACFLLVNLLTFVSSLPIPLQLLSKQIGISGHIHRLMAGSMAGNLSFRLIRLASARQLDIMYCTGSFFFSCSKQLFPLNLGCLHFVKSWINMMQVNLTPWYCVWLNP